MLFWDQRSFWKFLWSRLNSVTPHRSCSKKKPPPMMCTKSLIIFWQLCVFILPVDKWPNRQHDIMSRYFQWCEDSNRQHKHFLSQPKCWGFFLLSTFSLPEGRKPEKRWQRYTFLHWQWTQKPRMECSHPSPFLEQRKPPLLHFSCHGWSVYTHLRFSPQVS